MKTIEHLSSHAMPLVRLGDELQRLVTSVYGDAYGAALAANSEAGLWVGFNALITPPLMGHGEPYRVRYIVPYERHIKHHRSYGRPVPAGCKDIFADRGATAGELGLLGRRQELLDTVIVKLPGARYEVHGIKSYVCPLLFAVRAEAAAVQIRRAAERQGPWLGGFASLAYDTPGYGYGDKDADGTTLLQRRIGEIARSITSGGVDVNDQRTWDGGAFGTPIFSHEDRIAGSNVLNAIIARLGVMPSVADDASMVITPGRGTLSGDGKLIEETAREH